VSIHEVIHADGSMTPLRFFLQKSMLSTDTEANDEDEKTPVSLTGAACLTLQKVTISTVHAAKGLEWPVVFIPAGAELYCHALTPS
jgi:DNA helicase-2/ATP-dependent DNA helicase PcrA